MSSTAAPAAWAEWRSKTLELARECERCACANEAEWIPNQRYTAAELDAARAALAAHLDEVPMGDPRGWLRHGPNLDDHVHLDKVAADWTAECYRQDGFRCYVSPLYRHPRER